MGFLEDNLAKNLRKSADLSIDKERSHVNRRSGSPYPRKTPNSALALAAVTAAVDQKSLDVRALDISANSDICDYFVICSGTSERHVKGICDKIKNELSKSGETPISVEGYEKGEWILMDYGDLVVHIFYEPMRQHYRLDELWSERGEELTLNEELQQHMRMLKTGISW